MASRRLLVLTTEEEELLMEHPERLRMLTDRSLLAEEERIFIHHVDPSACPSVWYIPKPNLDRLSFDPPSLNATSNGVSKSCNSRGSVKIEGLLSRRSVTEVLCLERRHCGRKCGA